MKTKKATTEVITAKQSQFAVQADYSSERTGNYSRRDKILKKWEFTGNEINGCGNCHNSFYWDIQEQTFVFSDEFLYDNERYIGLYKIMSASLLLYRLIATFFGAPSCEDNYKSIWYYTIKHKPSGKQVSFSEWKGSIGFWVTDSHHRQLKSEFKADLTELWNYLISNECAHPYDNLVAGSIA